MQDNGLPDPPGQCARRLVGFGIRPTAQRVRIASLLLASPHDVEDNPGGLLQWIREGVRRFHELTL